MNRRVRSYVFGADATRPGVVLWKSDTTAVIPAPCLTRSLRSNTAGFVHACAIANQWGQKAAPSATTCSAISACASTARRLEPRNCASAHEARTMPNMLTPERYPQRWVIRLKSHDSGTDSSARLTSSANLNERSAASFVVRKLAAAATANGPPKKSCATPSRRLAFEAGPTAPT